MISVVVCTYNRSQSLGATVASLRRMRVPPDLAWELIVVDNNSTDDTRTVIQEFARTSGLQVRYIFEGRQGKSHALNAGLREARGEVIAFTDDDVLVDADWLTGLLAVFKCTGAMGVGGKSLPDWTGVTKPSWVVTEGPYSTSWGLLIGLDLGDEPVQLRAAPWGLNMAFRRSAFDKYGTFRTDLGAAGSKLMLGEDTEFGNRLIKAGEKVMYAPKAIVRHPMDPRRLTKPYMLSYFFAGGRTLARTEGWPPNTVCYFGVPRYTFRDLAGLFIRWMTSVDTKRRFYFRLRVYECSGVIYEAYKLAHERT